MAIFVHPLVAIIAVGTTKHITDPCFFEADEITRGVLGLPCNTRFLDCFVHAFWHAGNPVDVCGRVDGKKQSPFKKAAERALMAHANGQLIPTIPARADLAALPTPTLADPFWVELYEMARAFASTPARSSGNTSPAVTANPDDGEGNAGSLLQPKDDDGDGPP